MNTSLIRHFIIALLLLCRLPLSAQFVSEEQAQQMATSFWTNQHRDNSNSKNAVNKVRAIGRKRIPAMYAFSQDSSWVLIAADERVTPILAFSDENTSEFPSDEEMPPAMKNLLDWYEYQIEYIRDSTTITKRDSGWITQRYEDPSIGLITPVPPLLIRNGEKNRWKQRFNEDGLSASIEKSYNKFCPSRNGCNHTIVGCVAVAMSQVMWYWQWPNAAVVADDDGNYLLREYDWSLMPVYLSNSSTLEEADMVATLLHDAGVSVNMNYGCGSSGADPGDISPALRDIFNYSADDLVTRSSYTNAQWIAMLKNELDHIRPILYGGRDSDNNGHRFVIDGYMYDNHFHINIGWGNEQHTGFFLLDSIGYSTNPYQWNQSAIMHITPNYPTCSDIVVQPSESWQPNFSKFNGGGMTIGNRTIASNHKGVIFSGDYVRLTNGFHISAGAEVRIGIRDIDCDVPLLLNNEPTTTERIERTTKAGFLHKQNILSFSPNPVSDILYIHSSEALTQVRIYNLNGQCLLQTSETQINVAALPPGLYLLTALTIADETFQTKFIKQ